MTHTGDKMHTTTQLLTYVEQHGFEAWIEDGEIQFDVPISYPDGTWSSELISCEPTLAAVRTALGY
jgi:hypothetical protein